MVSGAAWRARGKISSVAARRVAAPIRRRARRPAAPLSAATSFICLLNVVKCCGAEKAKIEGALRRDATNEVAPAAIRVSN